MKTLFLRRVEMKITKIKNIFSAEDETVYEMVGCSTESGGTKYHNIVQVLMPAAHFSPRISRFLQNKIQRYYQHE